MNLTVSFRCYPPVSIDASFTTLGRTSPELIKASAQFIIPSRCQILYPLEDHIGDFMDIFSYESVRPIGDQNVLRKVDALMD